MSDLTVIVAAVTALIIAVTNFVIAVATLLVAMRNGQKTSKLEKEVNGRLNQLLVERERRVRAEYAPALVPLPTPLPPRDPKP